MPRVLIMPAPLRHRPGRYREILANAGFESIDPPGYHRLHESDLVEAVREADAILAGGDPVTARIIAAGTRLRAIARAGVGSESVDLAAATARSIAVASTPGANHEAVAEHALALLLSLTRNIIGNDRMVRAGGWERRPVRPLRGTTLGVIGLGRIGQAVARRGRALGMTVLAHDRQPRHEFVAAHGVTAVSFDEVLAGSDVVSINLPLNRETFGLFDRRTFERMRRGAILINTARGALVNEVDLFDALASGHLAGAGLDVLVKEPPDRDNPLLTLPNVVYSPHIAGVDTTALDDMAEHAAHVMIDLYQGRWPEGYVVNDELRARWRW
ncbi:MAG: phosphoglycerate dehydrogenase [Isosphaeraceae bacterium]